MYITHVMLSPSATLRTGCAKYLGFLLERPFAEFILSPSAALRTGSPKGSEPVLNNVQE